MAYNGPSETNYFIEVHPGDALSASMRKQKNRLLAIPNSQYVNDDPHFTMIAARTSDMTSLMKAVNEVAGSHRTFTYEIVEMGEIQYQPNGLVEVRAVVHPDHRKRFRDVHLAIVKASSPYKSRTLMDRYNFGVWNDEQKRNLEYCGFPNARNLFAPHASLGRFQPEDMNKVRDLISGYDPRGEYTAYKMILWRLPTVQEDPKETPEKLEELLFAL